MELSGKACYAAGKELPGFGNETLEDLRVLVVDGFQGDVDAAAWHRLVGAAEGRTTFWSLRSGHVLLKSMLRAVNYQCCLANFAVERVALEERIVFLFL